MKLGALLGPITDPSDPSFLAEQARTFEGEGYTSLWAAQAVGRGFMVTDPIVALTVAASATDTVEIGTAVLQVPLYDPLDLAYRVLSLQQVAGERLRLGVGAGSTQSDFDTFSRDYARRFKDFEGSLATLREVFTTGGSGTRQLSPWPAVQGGPPIFFGTWGKGVERAAREFDGWIASGMHRTPEQVAAAAERYFNAGGGRAIVSTLQVSGKTDLGELKARFETFAAAGFHDAVVMLLPGAPEPAAIRALLP